MIIELPPQTEQIIAQVAKEKGQSVHDFIVMSAYEKAVQAMTDKPQAQGLGERIHLIFAKADFPELSLPQRTDHPRHIES
ncbi:Uncharacterised protein [Moraxella lacunata]|mgnify:FL=1|uniref:DUF1778 domain-containing protein n=1 Tax=Moraxella lacunata TaxID=477 RepID=A0A1V4GRQ7_MORLA|nr:DUF1778 domain-containing protein [Moraxella lacunata]OPH35369.1 hypothetical protein B5J94_09880 [Moraxella lacunata]STZ01412.1 Uncharacterised protein [Moraxella lacunata]